VTTLRVHVGGADGRRGLAASIHWHVNVANAIEYIATDNGRQAIPYVRMTDRQGLVREYFADGATPELLAKGTRRRIASIVTIAQAIRSSRPPRARSTRRWQRGLFLRRCRLPIARP
jgi:hypothetical protein